MKNEKTIAIFLLVLILFLQLIFLWVSIDKSAPITINNVFSIIGVLLTVIGWLAIYYFGIRKSKKEIGLKEKLTIYREISHHLINEVFDSYFKVTALIRNQYNLEACNVKDTNDTFTKITRENYLQLTKAQHLFYYNFFKIYEYFQAWKPLFSEGIDYESKFMFGEGWSFFEKITEYQKLLSNYLYLGFNKTTSDLEKEKAKLISLEDELQSKQVILTNALTKFILDMSHEVFDGLYKKEDEKRLFSLEIENLEDGIELDILTKEGIKKHKYQKTDFQKKFGSLIKNQLEKN